MNESSRLVSLDVFRGATIASMILVNNPGSWEHVYPPLRHAVWHGWTFTDLVFPFFLWIVGVAMTLSFARRVERGEDKRKLFLHVLRRSAILFLLGLFLGWFGHYSFATLRIPGVLQRIAVCYLIAAAIYLAGGIRWCAISCAALLALYWALMMLAPVPGIGAGVLEKDHNLASYIDSLFLQGHMWTETKTWDPEGILSTLPAIGTALFGILAGEGLRRKKSTGFLLATGIALIVAGQIMNVWLPINKNLWTSSYAVFMAGMAQVLFAACYWLVDVRGWKRWARPFATYGMNAIAVYVLSGAVERAMQAKSGSLTLQEHVYNGLSHWLSPINASLAYALGNVLVLWAVAWFLYRRKWFVRF